MDENGEMLERSSRRFVGRRGKPKRSLNSGVSGRNIVRAQRGQLELNNLLRAQLRIWMQIAWRRIAIEWGNQGAGQEHTQKADSYRGKRPINGDRWAAHLPHREIEATKAAHAGKSSQG